MSSPDRPYISIFNFCWQVRVFLVHLQLWIHKPQKSGFYVVLQHLLAALLL
jgi:hypothetical protein